jgi:hypothetical protein
MTSIESNPAFSEIVLGITSKDLAKELIINYYFPEMVLA